ncbi:carbohydrate-binding protein [Parapedobacter sp. SGR-10]|uniref:carbohydrate-binding protein n=1 Tax=Parapedobacter sp. SGR-10 TaxID=2710879 RepID=UPI0013D62DA6|nr:carbohydrate-binding protein [Parapedobacter sp. SGR-10]NGF55830.1 carbohydrate-binding protein [Parapedobacter sp. SGR-10]
MRKLVSIVFTAVLWMTTQGFAQEKGKRIEAESFSTIHRATTKEVKTGTVVNKFDKGAWIKFDNLDFGKGTEQLKFKVSSGSENSPQLEVRLGDHKGKLLGTLKVESKNWGKYVEQSLTIPQTKGKQTITIVSTAGGVLLDWFELMD